MNRFRLALTCALLALLSACSPSGAGPDDGRATVVAAVYPLGFVVGEIGGDRVDLEMLTAPGVEPHDLELSPEQVGMLTESDLVVYVGNGFQPAVEDALGEVDPSRLLDVLAGATGEDPHIWLDPILMSRVAGDVATRLSEIDPDGAEVYEANLRELGQRLEALDADLSEGLATCRNRHIVTSHLAFGFFARRYGVLELAIGNVDPQSEPSPHRLAEVARFVREHDVTTIFFEELVSPGVAETVASETGADTALLSPLESKPADGDYFDGMRRNLVALRKALDCE